MPQLNVREGAADGTWGVVKGRRKLARVEALVLDSPVMRFKLFNAHEVRVSARKLRVPLGGPV